MLKFLSTTIEFYLLGVVQDQYNSGSFRYGLQEGSRGLAQLWEAQKTGWLELERVGQGQVSG